MNKRLLSLAAVLLVLPACTPTPAPTETETTPPAASAPALKDNWMEVTGDTYTLQLPNDWMLFGEEVPGSPVVKYEGPASEGIEIYNESLGDNADLSAYLTAQDAMQATAYEGQPGVTVKDTDAMTVNGYPVIRRHEYANAAGLDMYVSYILANGKVYAISTWRVDAGDVLTAVDRDFHDEIVATFMAK